MLELNYTCWTLGTQSICSPLAAFTLKARNTEAARVFKFYNYFYNLEKFVSCIPIIIKYIHHFNVLSQVCIYALMHLVK